VTRKKLAAHPLGKKIKPARRGDEEDNRSTAAGQNKTFMEWKIEHHPATRGTGKGRAHAVKIRKGPRRAQF
jgi:hypothetical protein